MNRTYAEVFRPRCRRDRPRAAAPFPRLIGLPHAWVRREGAARRTRTGYRSLVYRLMRRSDCPHRNTEHRLATSTDPTSLRLSFDESSRLASSSSVYWLRTVLPKLLRQEQLAILDLVGVSWRTKRGSRILQRSHQSRQRSSRRHLSSANAICATKFSGPKTSSISARTRWTFSSPICTKHDPDSVKQLASDEQSVSQVGEVRVDAEFPGVAEGLDLLGLACGVLELAVLDVASSERRPASSSRT